MYSFDEENHIYRIDGLIVPSVTQMLEDNGLVDFSYVSKKHKQALENARWKGLCYHKATEYRDEGILREATVSTSLVPLLEAWEKFLADYRVEILAVEYQNVSYKHSFGFTIDRIIRIHDGPNKRWLGKIAILEIKTSSTIDKTVKYQLAGYQIGWNEHNPDKKAKLRLTFKPTEDGYIIKESDGANDASEFLTLLGATHIKRRMA